MAVTFGPFAFRLLWDGRLEELEGGARCTLMVEPDTSCCSSRRPVSSPVIIPSADAIPACSPCVPNSPTPVPSAPLMPPSSSCPAPLSPSLPCATLLPNTPSGPETAARSFPLPLLERGPILNMLRHFELILPAVVGVCTGDARWSSAMPVPLPVLTVPGSAMVPFKGGWGREGSIVRPGGGDVREDIVG